MAAGVKSLGLCCLLVLCLTSGCKAATVTVPVTIVATSLKTVTVTSATPLKTTPTTTPKLVSLSINLAVVAPGDYDAYVVPLYLTGDMVLHMSWNVEGGDFRMTVTTPEGKVIPITTDGVQTSGTAEPLDNSGGIVFCTSDAAYSSLDWGDGYFDFTPNLIQGDAPVKITLNYYFDTLPDTASTVSTTPATSATAAIPTNSTISATPATP
jgi:hypothetical protein